MFNLLRKDILVQKQTIWFALGYSIFVFFAFSNKVFSPYVYIMGTVALSYVLILSAVQSEYKNNSDVVLLSLPVKRREVVAAKYLAVFVFVLLSFLTLGIIGLIFKLSPLPFPTRLINWQDAVVVLISVILLVSIYLPTYYKMGGKWLQVINVVLFMIIFFAPSTLASLMRNYRQVQSLQWITRATVQNPQVAVWLGIAFIGGLMLISYLISIHIYENQDF